MLMKLQESIIRQIDLTEDHTPDQVNALVDYMYTFQYAFTATTDFQDTVGFHVNMAILADKYDIRGLHKFATRTFTELSLDNAESLAAAAKTAYTAPGATVEIRKSLVQSVILRQGLLSGAEDNALVQAMRFDGNFALDVARELAQPPRRDPLPRRDALSRHHCPDCYATSEIVVVLASHLYRCGKCGLSNMGQFWRKEKT